MGWPEKERLDKIKELSNEAIAYKKEGEFNKDYYIDILENKNIATNEYCPLKYNKQKIIDILIILLYYMNNYFVL